MKTTTKLLLFCCIILFSITCNISEKKNKNFLLLKEPILSLGKIQHKSNLDTFFLVQNISEIDVEIYNISGSCYCTIPSKKKLTIRSGEISKVYFSYKAENLGRFQQTISFKTNVEDERLIQLIRGRVGVIIK